MLTIKFKVTQITQGYSPIDGTTPVNTLKLDVVDPAGDVNHTNYGLWPGGPSAVVSFNGMDASKVGSVALGQLINLTFAAG